MNECLICNKKALFKKFLDLGKYRYETCANCSGAILQPHKKAISEVEKIYTSEYFDWTEKSILKGFINKIYLYKGYPQWITATTKVRGKKILDVGAGIPKFVYSMKKLGWQSYALEFSKKQSVLIGTYIGRKNVFNGDFEKFKLQSNLFDVVTFWHVLEHVKDPWKTIKKVNKILRTGGEVFIEVPNLDSYSLKLFGKDYTLLGIPEHLYYYNARSLKELFEGNGFRVDEISYPLKLNSTFAASLKDRLKIGSFLYYIMLPVSLLVSIVGSMVGQSEVVRMHATKITKVV